MDNTGASVQHCLLAILCIDGQGHRLVDACSVECMEFEHFAHAKAVHVRKDRSGEHRLSSKDLWFACNKEPLCALSVGSTAVIEVQVAVLSHSRPRSGRL